MEKMSGAQAHSPILQLRMKCTKTKEHREAVSCRYCSRDEVQHSRCSSLMADYMPEAITHQGLIKMKT